MAKRRLGQHFLYDAFLLRKIVDAAGLSPDDTVVEIGPGPGRLTRTLSERVRRVIAIELDGGLYERLKADLPADTNIELVLGDALKFPYEEIGPFKVVSNIPYYITTPIIFRLIEARKTLKSMTLTIQKEVAERIVAGPGTKDYGILSIMVQYRARPELKFIVGKESFRPAPKVDSAVVHIELLNEPAVKMKDEKLFSLVVKTSFGQRRKTLANSLKGLCRDARPALERAGIDPMRRPETLSLEEFARLSDSIGE